MIPREILQIIKYLDSQTKILDREINESYTRDGNDAKINRLKEQKEVLETIKSWILNKFGGENE